MNKTQNQTTGELGEREYCRGAATPEKVEWASCAFPRVTELPLLTEKERHQLLVAWNDTATDYPKDKCIHQLFEEQVEKNPDAVAVVFEDQQLTYRELNCRANQLAHYLQSEGVGTEVLVGICVERSIEMVVGWLGIIKAGGAYVPIDPAYPQERLDYILEDSSVSVLLTESKLVEALPSSLAQVILLDADWDVITSESQENPVNQTKPNNLAYVIYTSGSTGRPKGVLIPHSGLINLVFWHQRNFAIASSDRSTQIAATAFDASVWELWPYLTAGATIYLVKAETILDPEKLRDWLVLKQITITFVPTPLAEKLLSLDWPENIALRILLTGGDKLSRFPSNSIPFKLVNNYGPTENTVVTTSGLVKSSDQQDFASPDIGRPIANTQIYILDNHLQPVSIGVAGEIHIGGAGLARGYLNRPDLTEQKFIPNPFSNQPGSRLYKTGDLGRYKPDGNIEFVGRIDNQVKIRGLRIELGEIEATLIQYPEVAEVVVIVREDNPGNKQLVAYIVPNSELTIRNLRDFLKSKLPHYMVPSAFVLLEAMPLTPNGKVDRRALPAPDTSSWVSETSFVAPRNSMELELTEIWSEVLGVSPIGVHDNLIELGGHSLLAIKIIGLVRSRLLVELPLNSLFEFPTVAELAKVVTEVRDSERSHQQPPLEPISRKQTIPLSFAQEQLWFLSQLAPEEPLYNETFTIDLAEAIDIPALEASLTELIRRHEILRTTYPVVNGLPIQEIHPPSAFTLPVIDLRDFPEMERETEALRIATEQLRKAFDLSKKPLLQATLIQLASTDYRLYLAAHHILVDGESMGYIVFTELETIYRAFCQGLPSPLPELTIQYADFVAWQRQWLQGEIISNQLAYWQKKLENLPQLQLPTDRPPTSKTSFAGSLLRYTLSQELSEQLNNFSRKEGVTLFMTLAAAIKVLLYRYSAQEDIVIGTVTSQRNRPELQGVIGYFLNTLVLRSDLSGNPSFRELLKRVRNVILSAYAHQDLPFEKVVSTLHPDRQVSRNPLFQVMLALQPPLTEENLPWKVSQWEVDPGISKVDLTFSVEERVEGIVIAIEYKTDLFDTPTIERMMGHLITELQGIVTNPNQPISDLPLLTAKEQDQLLVEWNNNQISYPQEQCIHHLFYEQVKKTPEAVAVVFENQQLTYRQLNNRANKLAHYLQKLGVKPDAMVGLFLNRSLEMIVGLLGILKAGGAYVPIDPTYPTERIAYMLEDSGVSVLLTQSNLQPILPEYQGLVIGLDSDGDVMATESEENPVSGVTSKDLAYAIYTSGSTGKPKGVLVTHQGLCNLANEQIRVFDLRTTSRVLQFFSISFDGSISEIVMALCSGARLCLVPTESTRLGSDLKELLQKHSITHISLVPSALATLTCQDLPTLQTIIVAGEACPQELVKKWSKERRFFNAYGPSEYTVCATVAEFTDRNQKLTIGGPIGNTQIYILDKHLQSVPIGVPGELHIGGVGLARGYLNRPDLTEQKFIPNPFSNKPGSRLYKTGDLARYLPDGTIEFLGRIDHQVKIRGFRIELSEIEAVLTQHPDVLCGVVIDREDTPGNKRLVAYVVPKVEVAISNLRDFLKTKLPDYMIPSAFVLMEALPLTPNGKVDRRALPAPDSFSQVGEDKFVAPQTPMEKILASIWAEVLGLKRVGINDNFFELGGSSLQAAFLVSKLEEEINRNVSVKVLFQHPTIAELAAAINILLAEVGNREQGTGNSGQELTETLSEKYFGKKSNQLPSIDTSLNPENPQNKLDKTTTKSLNQTTKPSQFIQLEQRSLLSLFALGKLASVDAAALGYIPMSFLKQTSLSRDQILEDWFDNLAMWYCIMQTQLGRIGCLILPIFEDRLYRDSQKLLQLSVEALEMAGRIGAKTVSLTGLIPSATDYGRAIVKAIEGRNDLPKITTGHATTCATVVLTIKKILQVSHRSLEQEKVAFIGLGSVGISTLSLMLRSLPHPTVIILCDVYSKREFMEKIEQELVSAYGFQGQIRIAPSASELPPEIYDASLIIGATNVPDILDINRLKPGTLIVDDSGPHCFSSALAIKRFEQQKDILFTEGGMLQAPHPIETVIYLPKAIDNSIDKHLWQGYSRQTNPLDITGCVMSSLLSSRFDDMEPTVGFLNLETSFQHYQGLEQFGFQAADLHCDGYVLQIK
ncbi:amino acid adenylation domain-containing protein [Moorena producens JHB]|uniref:Amino acid adenylation domain-containing protein n=1 Tax=Moorena producens (strain JHB) TaxID=1454205 RepID=A0A1D9FUW2_MOOP1|nr:non-ribosomal peptide synthetase [Moorena producens]AOY79166.2 amino acid adenylation domain-containing protein [Moorena producens JHB]